MLTAGRYTILLVVQVFTSKLVVVAGKFIDAISWRVEERSTIKTKKEEEAHFLFKSPSLKNLPFNF